MNKPRIAVLAAALCAAAVLAPVPSQAATTERASVGRTSEESPDFWSDFTCDQLAAMSGGPFDQALWWDIRSDGDVYVWSWWWGWVWFLDCPPYETSGS